MDLTGTTIGEVYEVEGLLGQGRFASVYTARHSLADRVVALKVFKSELTKKAGGSRRFLRKARMAADQPHPAIVPIEDRGMGDDGIAYVAMELLAGTTLEATVKKGGPLTVDRSLKVIHVVLEALAAIHEEGHTHRNLNPANVFLTEDESGTESVRILDFGVVQELVDFLAVSPEVVGSTSFLAPEFLLSPNKVWTTSIDVFAAGMVFFYMLTGRLPFNKEDHVGDDPDAKTIGIYGNLSALPGPAYLSPHVPQAIDEVVQIALSVHPEDRFTDASAMLEALREAEAKPSVEMKTDASKRPVVPKTTLEEEPVPPPKKSEKDEAPTERMHVDKLPDYSELARAAGKTQLPEESTIPEIETLDTQVDGTPAVASEVLPITEKLPKGVVDQVLAEPPESLAATVGYDLRRAEAPSPQESDPDLGPTVAFLPEKEKTPERQSSKEIHVPIMKFDADDAEVIPNTVALDIDSVRLPPTAGSVTSASNTADAIARRSRSATLLIVLVIAAVIVIVLVLAAVGIALHLS